MIVLQKISCIEMLHDNWCIKNRSQYVCLWAYVSIQKVRSFFSNFLRPKPPPISVFFHTYASAFFDEFCNPYPLPLIWHVLYGQFLCIFLDQRKQSNSKEAIHKRRQHFSGVEGVKIVKTKHKSGTSTKHEKNKKPSEEIKRYDI